MNLYAANVYSNLIRDAVNIYIDIKVEINVQPLHLNRYLSGAFWLYYFNKMNNQEIKAPHRSAYGEIS
jgi:hypothetical protein